MHMDFLNWTTFPALCRLLIVGFRCCFLWSEPHKLFVHGNMLINIHKEVCGPDLLHCGWVRMIRPAHFRLPGRSESMTPIISNASDFTAEIAQFKASSTWFSVPDSSVLAGPSLCSTPGGGHFGLLHCFSLKSVLLGMVCLTKRTSQCDTDIYPSSQRALYGGVPHKDDMCHILYTQAHGTHAFFQPYCLQGCRHGAAQGPSELAHPRR